MLDGEGPKLHRAGRGPFSRERVGTRAGRGQRRGRGAKCCWPVGPQRPPKSGVRSCISSQFCPVHLSAPPLVPARVPPDGGSCWVSISRVYIPKENEGVLTVMTQNLARHPALRPSTSSSWSMPSKPLVVSLGPQQVGSGLIPDSCGGHKTSSCW